MRKTIYLLILIFGMSLGTQGSEGQINYDISIVATDGVNIQEEKKLNHSVLATLIENEKKEYVERNIFYLSSGGNFSKGEDKYSPRDMTKILNALKLRATTLGDGDFDYGIKELEEIKKRANFKILASNIKYLNGEGFLDSHFIGSIEGKKIGIMGLVHPKLYEQLTEEDKKKIIIEDPHRTALKLAEAFKKAEVEYIIILSSLGKGEEYKINHVIKDTMNVDLVLDGGSFIDEEKKKEETGSKLVREEKNLGSVGMIQIDLDQSLMNPNRIKYEQIKEEDMGKTLPNGKTIKIEKNSKMEKLIKTL